MDTTSLTAVVHLLGLDHWLALILAFHAFASAVDAAIPQPSAGSNWLPVRKVVSFLALNFAHSTNANQPAFVTWLQALVMRLSVLVPPPPPAAAPPAPLFPAQPYPATPAAPPPAPVQPAPPPAPPPPPPGIPPTQPGA